MNYKTSFLIRPFGISVDRGIRTLCRKRHYCRRRTTSHCSHAGRSQWSTRGFFVRLAAVVRTLEPYFDILSNAVGSIPEVQLGLSVFGTLRSRHGTITYTLPTYVHQHIILFFRWERTLCTEVHLCCRSPLRAMLVSESGTLTALLFRVHHVFRVT